VVTRAFLAIFVADDGNSEFKRTEAPDAAPCGWSRAPKVCMPFRLERLTDRCPCRLVYGACALADHGVSRVGDLEFERYKRLLQIYRSRQANTGDWSAALSRILRKPSNILRMPSGKRFCGIDTARDQRVLILLSAT
jgi:hypothetical protein